MTQGALGAGFSLLLIKTLKGTSPDVHGFKFDTEPTMFKLPLFHTNNDGVEPINANNLAKYIGIAVMKQAVGAQTQAPRSSGWKDFRTQHQLPPAQKTGQMR